MLVQVVAAEGGAVRRRPEAAGDDPEWCSVSTAMTRQRLRAPDRRPALARRCLADIASAFATSTAWPVGTTTRPS